MNAPPFPLNPDVGEWSGDWAWNGARWVAASTTGLRVLTRTFTASGPYMPTPGLVSVMVECIGGGGEGGSVVPPDAYGVYEAGGGGSGGYSRKTLPAALVRGGVMVTVGSGGTGGGSGANISGSPTSFGAFCVANGGGAAQDFAVNYDQYGLGGTGATKGIGDVVMSGSVGETGGTQQQITQGTAIPALAHGGNGGTMWGGTPSVNQVWVGGSVAGVAGDSNTGAGGSGACANQTTTGIGTTTAFGGAGGSGICIVTEYVVGDRDQPVTEWRPPLDVNVTMRPPKPPWPGGPPGPPPWPGGGPWPPGSPWWWWGLGPWPSSSLPGPRPREAVEFEAGQPYDQSINPETELPWEDDT